ncbi:hypothetical protein FIV42_08520 [Persicimonas caeni]|uniref:Uncharacterized protein n=1 Tax=Persicimonas caeni TaxID=2292766 RepID=A0A4Y6PRC3_PERCE|nr:hypothetical protein [Persicimonas caeni]QDG50773.1 hypothetical protein FIV42_08520 [Persicimonas caeni]QED31994.1 hypothetical protein FRD00_08515 [Persicimonas caeni]
MKKLVLMSVLVAFSAGAAGCDLIGCTEVGCGYPITLSFEDSNGEPIDGFEGEITAGDETISVSCGPDGAQIGESYECRRASVVLFEAPDVDSLQLDIRTSDDASALAYVGSVDLDYGEYYPNGEFCPPECREAEETVTMTPTQSTDG